MPLFFVFSLQIICVVCTTAACEKHECILQVLQKLGLGGKHVLSSRSTEFLCTSSDSYFTSFLSNIVFSVMSFLSSLFERFGRLPKRQRGDEAEELLAGSDSLSSSIACLVSDNNEIPSGWVVEEGGERGPKRSKQSLPSLQVSALQGLGCALPPDWWHLPSSEGLRCCPCCHMS